MPGCYRRGWRSSLSAAFAAKRPLGPAQTWRCTVTAVGDVEWLRDDVVRLRRLRFARSDFTVKGALPAPAV